MRDVINISSEKCAAAKPRSHAHFSEDRWSVSADIRLSAKFVHKNKNRNGPDPTGSRTVTVVTWIMETFI